MTANVLKKWSQIKSRIIKPGRYEDEFRRLKLNHKAEKLFRTNVQQPREDYFELLNINYLSGKSHNGKNI